MYAGVGDGKLLELIANEVIPLMRTTLDGIEDFGNVELVTNYVEAGRIVGGSVTFPRSDPAAVHDLMRTIARQRENILAMERALQQFKITRRRVMQVQDDLIHGRVDKARVGISKLLMEWPHGL